jgi:Bacterial PH domain
LSTFEQWPGTLRPGVTRCDDCVRMVPSQNLRMPNPHLRHRSLADGTAPQWSYMSPPGERWLLLVISPMCTMGVPVFWLVLRRRLIVRPDGVTIVGALRTKTFLWGDILRFDVKTNGAGLFLIPRTGPTGDAPVSIWIGTNVTRRATELNHALLGEQVTTEPDAQREKRSSEPAGADTDHELESGGPKTGDRDDHVPAGWVGDDAADTAPPFGPDETDLM